MTETTPKILSPFAETVLFKILAPEHQGFSSDLRLRIDDTAWETWIWLGKSETDPEQRGSENNPKTGADDTHRNFMVARDTRSTLGPSTKRTAW